MSKYAKKRTPTVKKINGYTPFSESIYMAKFNILLMNSLEITLEIH